MGREGKERRNVKMSAGFLVLRDDKSRGGSGLGKRRTPQLTYKVEDAFDAAAMVWILSIPQGPCVKGLQPMALLGSCRTFRRWGLEERI